MPGWMGRLKVRALVVIAKVYRFLLLPRVHVITVTGSCGKTTAKDAIHHVLSSKYGGIKTRQSLNSLASHLNAVLRTRPWHRFCVLEAGIFTRGQLHDMIQAIRPDIGVVLTVGYDHYSEFHGPEAVAAEKVQVVTRLANNGLAVLNADDPFVSAMAEKTGAKVVMYGRSDRAELRVENVASRWPERLSFDVVSGSERCHVQTRFCGEFWVAALLPAIACGMRLGMSLEEAATALTTLEPTYQRMFPVTMPDGVSYILDDWKASYWTLDYAINFMVEARASKKIMVLGSVADHSGSAERIYRRLVRKTSPVVDVMIITGSKIRFARNAPKGSPLNNVLLVPEIKDVADILRRESTPGSLVMLKGTTKLDHLIRLFHNHEKPISCWRTDCRINFHCRPCPELYRRET
ncbi:MAG TPA: Mur ligase family protein [Kiritimatiellia bacterium]|nr:Mur ligase family protein [Kiritimatiellia bacterium]